MTTVAMKKKLHEFIDMVEDKKVKALYTLFEGEIDKEDSISGHWDDPEFIAELDRRYEEYTSGKVKAISAEQVKKNTRKLLKELESKKAS